MLGQVFMLGIGKQIWAHGHSCEGLVSTFCVAFQGHNVGVTHELKYKMNEFILNFPGKLLAQRDFPACG